MLQARTTDENVHDWHAIDHRLRSIARQRAALDAEEAQLLRAANRMQIWRTIADIPGDLALDALLREALRRCRKPK